MVHPLDFICMEHIWIQDQRIKVGTQYAFLEWKKKLIITWKCCVKFGSGNSSKVFLIRWYPNSWWDLKQPSVIQFWPKHVLKSHINFGILTAVGLIFRVNICKYYLKTLNSDSSEPVIREMLNLNIHFIIKFTNCILKACFRNAFDI